MSSLDSSVGSIKFSSSLVAAAGAAPELAATGAAPESAAAGAAAKQICLGPALITKTITFTKKKWDLKIC